ncbi:hypothetical protein GCM10023147_48290 [Tsukamurella soli]|uniref:Uncharacterized protein n=1 Tax=Tsukamurella soli TaxID=644556 RepID=A0ABP8KF18_9ACTN
MLEAAAEGVPAVLEDSVAVDPVVADPLDPDDPHAVSVANTAAPPTATIAPRRTRPGPIARHARPDTASVLFASNPI